MDILRDVVAPQAPQLVSGLVRMYGMTAWEAERFLQTVGDRLTVALRRQPEVGLGDAQALARRMVAGDVAAEAGIPPQVAQTALDYVLPRLASLLEERFGTTDAFLEQAQHQGKDSLAAMAGRFLGVK